MDFETLKPAKLMLKMCIPSVITILIMEIYHMADIFFVGQLENTAMVSGISLASPIIALVSTIGVLVGGGGSSALAMMLGKKDLKSAEQVVSFCYWSSAVLGLAAGIILFFASEYLARLFGAKGNAFVYCSTYIKIYAVGVPFMCFSSAMGSMIRGNGKSRQSLAGNMTGTLLNILLDPIFILIMKLDVAGAAIATVISNIASAVFYVIYIRPKHFGLSCSLRNYTLKKDISLLVLNLGLPMASMTVFNFISGTMSHRVLASYGDVAVSSVSITSKIISLVTMIQMGITVGIQPVMAYNYGAGRRDVLNEYVKRTGVTVVCIGLLLTLICYLFGPQIVNMFMDIPEVVSLGVKCMKIMLLCAPIAGLHQLATSFFQAVKKPGLSLVLSVVRDGLLYLPILILFSSLWQLNGYMWARPVSTFCSVCISVVLMYRYFGILQE